MKNVPQICFELTKEHKTVRIYCDPDIPLGVLHDCLMEAKGYTVERMIHAQQQEEAITEEYKKLDSGENYNGSKS